MSDCKHESFDCAVNINRLEDIGRFQADVTVMCTRCGVPFRFIGLPAGLDLNGASVSVDGCEARMAIAPKGEVVAPLESVTCAGFTVRKTQGPEGGPRVGSAEWMLSNRTAERNALQDEVD